MLFVPFIYIGILIGNMIKIPLTAISVAVPDAVYTALGVVNNALLSFNGIFPMDTLLQVLYLVVSVWVIRIIWTLVVALWSLVPTVSPKVPKQLRNVPGLND